MQAIKQVLKNFNPTTDKYISREFQSFGVHLAEELIKSGKFDEAMQALKEAMQNKQK